MKTLVLLSALAALAAAAPANENQNKLGSSIQQIRRNKKSAFPEDLSDITKAADATLIPANDDDFPEARTFGLKKKVIHKKTHGSHYRDSSEEKINAAEPKEKCTKEVKVKFCEEENAARSNEIHAAEPSTDVEVKESLQKAREMVESIQKMTQTNAKSASDTEIHEDIEIARKALDHIQQNFEKLESLNLRFATLSNPEARETHLDTSKSGKRNAQWKGPSKHIQKEADENVEELLKSADQSIVADIDASKTLKSASSVMGESLNKPVMAKSSEHIMDFTFKNNAPEADDLVVAASEPKESIVEFKEKSSMNPAADVHNIKDALPKESSNPETLSDGLKSTLELKSSLRAAAMNPEELLTIPGVKLDLVAAAPSPTLTMKSAVEQVDVPELKFKASLGLKSVPEHDDEPTVSETRNGLSILAHEKNAAAENFNEKLNTARTNTEDKQKLQEQLSTKSVEEIMPIMKSSEKKEEIFKNVNFAENNVKETKMKAANEEIIANKNQFKMSSTHENQDQHIDMPPSVPQMKSAESTMVHHIEPFNAQAQEKVSVSMKTADPEPHGFHSFGHGGGSLHSHSSQQIHHSVSNSHHIGHHQHLGHLGHGIFKSSDMDGASSTVQLNMEEAKEKSALEQNKNQFNPTQKAALEQKMNQWSQKQNARGAYGAYGAGSGGYGAGLSGFGASGSGIGVSSSGIGAISSGGHGAVSAVFPGSQNRPCAIPLLLSCSPSVTSGSLKSHSYGGSAYRSEDFNLHSKRETKKINDIQSKKTKRTIEKNTLKTVGNKIQL